MNFSAPTGSAKRLFFIDNLRTIMVFLVVLVHAGFVYDHSLSSIWIVSDPDKDIRIFRIFMLLDIFIIPILFFASGYLSRLALERKSGKDFLAAKARRLLVPWAVAAFTLIPLYKAIFLFSRDLPQENPLSYFHFSGSMVMNQGWLWFLPVLFLFSVLHLALDRIIRDRFDVPVRVAVAAVFVVGCAYTFGFYYFKLRGWTKTPALDFQNERVLIYFMLYLLGALFRRKRSFEVARASAARRLAVLPVTGAAAVFAVIAMAAYSRFQWNYLITGGKIFIVSGTSDLLIITLSYGVALLTSVYLIVGACRAFLNRETPLLKELGADSYGVYIVHFVVTGAIALIFASFSLSAIAKWIAATAAIFVGSNLVVSAYRRSARRILAKVAGRVTARRSSRPPLFRPAPSEGPVRQNR